MVPTSCELNVKLAGESAITGATPVPETTTVCDVAGARTLTARFADAAPLAVGVNVTLIVQVAPAASELPQLLVCANGAGTVIELIDRAEPPVLDRVTLCAGVVVPTN